MCSSKCRSLLFATAAITGYALCIQPASAVPGTLDADFGNAGKIRTNIPGPFSGEAGATSVTILSNGRILVGGYAREGRGGIALAQYHANGSLDTSFGTSGTVMSNLGSGNSLVVQSDGKIVVAGSHIYEDDDRIHSDDFTLVRFNANGSLDATFDGDGAVRTEFSSFAVEQATSVALQSNGKIVAAGSFAGRVAVVRYNPNGALDTTFGGTGKVTTTIDTSYCYGSAVAIQADGKIVVAASDQNQAAASQNHDFALIRYLPNGALDPSFNGTGTVTTDIGFDWTTGMILQSDGAILVTGWTAPAEYSAGMMVLLRYTPSGILDTTLEETWSTGKKTFAIGAHSEGRGFALQSDGKILIAGYAATGSDLEFDDDDDGIPTDFALVRSRPDGSQDYSFHYNGRVTTDFGAADVGNSVAVQSDGKIVVAGASVGAFAVARYLGDGAEILVEQPAGTKLFDSAANVGFGSPVTNGSSDKIFTIKNEGGAPLTGLGITIDGSDAASFTVVGAPTSPLEANEDRGDDYRTTFTVRFRPTTSGAKTAVLHIASNDSDEGSFDITISGRSLAPDADEDGDGVSNAAEVNLSAIGFDPLINNAALTSVLNMNARSLGHYTERDIHALSLSSPILEKDASTGRLHLHMGVEKSSDLSNWEPLTGFTPAYDALTGRITLEITPDAPNVKFYRVFGDGP